MSKIAILLATYNGEKYLSNLLLSLEEQSNNDFVCFIHDDGSTDNTNGIVKDFISEHDASKYVVLEHPPLKSAKDNFLWMLKSVEADYYLFADQDDVWVSNKVEKLLVKIKGKDKAPTCVFSDMYIVDETLNKKHNSFIRFIRRDPFDLRYQRIIIDNPAAGCTMMVNKALRDIAIKLDDTSLIEMHDVFLLSIAAGFGEVIYIDEPLVLYRQHEQNVMGAKRQSDISRVFSNLALVLNGTLKKEKEAFHNQKRDLAKAIVSVAPNKESSNYKVLKDFSEIGKKAKINRIRFYKNNGFNRNKNNLWFYMWV